MLGFAVAWTWGTPPDRASVSRDNVEITLSKRGLADSHGPSRVFIQISDIDDYYATIRKAGAPIDVPLDDREYGMRDFHLIDPSGNQISFGQPIKINVEQSHAPEPPSRSVWHGASLGGSPVMLVVQSLFQ
ncbi:MAG: VOC family protein [Caldilinea sp.]